MSTRSQVFRYFLIKWNDTGARIFLNATNKMFEETIFPDPETAKSWILNYLKNEQKKRRDPTIPTSTEYYRTFKCLSFEEREWLMLEAHCNAKGNQLTPVELAQAAGNNNLEYANRWYGEVGRKVAEAMDLPMQSDEQKYWTESIARYDEDVWIMYPEVVSAIKQLNEV